MWIHYGLKDKNPVSRVRFFCKNAPPGTIAQAVDENVYGTMIPRKFEYRAVRVFCRNKEKDIMARVAFEKWCNENDVLTPFPSCSQE